MQLQFSEDEFRILVDVLIHRCMELRVEISHTDNRDFRRALQREQDLLDEIEDKVLRSEFELPPDELDFLVILIDRHDRELTEEIVRTDRREFRDKLLRRSSLLKGVRNKITATRAVA